MSREDDSTPEWERLKEHERVHDDEWNAIVEDFGRSTAYNSEVSAEEVKEYLEQHDDWEGPVIERVNLHDAQPARVVSLIALVAGVVVLVVLVVFIRPVPTWLALVCVGVAACGGVGAIFTLPRERHDDDGGARV